MKIPEKNISLFENKNSLLIVIGNYHGTVYQVADGEVEKKSEIKNEEPTRSDNEGMFKRGGSEQYSYGSVLESKDNEYQQRFSKEMFEILLGLSKEKKIDQIYLFRPQDMKNLIEKDWNRILQKTEVFYIDGNFVKNHPKELIEMIDSKYSQTKSKKPQGEAKAILEKIDK